MLPKVTPRIIHDAMQWYIFPVKVALLTSACYWETWAACYQGRNA